VTGEWSETQCRTCWNRINRGIVVGKAGTAPTVRKLPECRRLGNATGETVECLTCTGKVSLKLFACEAYGACTLSKKADGLACCDGGQCPSYTPMET
jgi:hypothetical protein